MPLSLSERIAWILRTRGLSVRQLALKATLSHTYVGALAKGARDNLTRASAEKLAAAAGVDPGWLMTGEGAPEPGAGALGGDPPALTQALALLEGRVAPAVRVALRAERPTEAWGVEKWIERALFLQDVYAKLPPDPGKS